MSTIRDIAKLAGVSIGAVSGVLNGKITVRPETHEKIMRAVEQTNYHINSVARSLRTRETRTLGLLLPTIVNPYYPRIALGVEDCANQYGYHVFLCNTERDIKRQKEYIYALVNKVVDGVILYNTELSKEDFSYLQKNNVAVVANYPVKSDCVDEVRMDHRNISKKMIQYLLSLGHKRIALINGPVDFYRCQERFVGMKEAYEEAGLKLDESLIAYSDFSQEFAYQCTLKLLGRKKPPSCIFTTDFMAAAVLNAASDLGVRVPENLSVAGLDQAVVTRPILTTVRYPSYETGRQLSEMIITRKRSNKPLEKRIIIIPSTIVIGNSTSVYSSTIKSVNANKVLPESDRRNK